MKTYKLEIASYNDNIEIGEKIEINSKYIIIVTILKVDFYNNIIWFTGIPHEDLNL